VGHPVFLLIEGLLRQQANNERVADLVKRKHERPCKACGGYLKTYYGEGSKAVLLADWTSLKFI
jgi:hypothetical protein